MSVNPLRIIDQTYHEVLPNKFETEASSVMLVAIGLQESRFVHRTQMSGGPARGFWQFEKSGGVRGVLLHPNTEHYAEAVCLIRHVKVQADAIHERLATDDVLACAFARLLLWSDPRPIPTVSDAALEYYLRIWRPRGWENPDEKIRNRWPANYAQAVEMVRAG